MDTYEASSKQMPTLSFNNIQSNRTDRYLSGDGLSEEFKQYIADVAWKIALLRGPGVEDMIALIESEYKRYRCSRLSSRS